MKFFLYGFLLLGLVCTADADILLVDEHNKEKIICEDGEEFLREDTEIFTQNGVIPWTGDLILVEIKKVRLTLYRHGKVLKTYPVAVGKPSTPSPVGEWKIVHKGGKWGGGFGDRWLGLNVPWGIYGIHGTNMPASIGRAASHGCIRMFNHNVRELYALVKIGTPVHIIGDLPKVSLRKEFARKDTGKEVLWVQFALRKSGFEPGPADARFGPGTENAVLKLQYFYGLPATGRLNMNEQYLIGLR